MKTGKYILGCSLLLIGLIIPICFGIFFYSGGRFTSPFAILIPFSQMFIIAFGWVFIIDSDPVESSWEFEKWLARKFYKID